MRPAQKAAKRALFAKAAAMAELGWRCRFAGRCRLPAEKGRGRIRSRFERIHVVVWRFKARGIADLRVW